MSLIKTVGVCFLFLFHFNSAKAQESTYSFVGKVVDNNSRPLEGINILIKRNSQVLRYLTTDINGGYKVSINISDTVKSLTIESKLLGYKSEAVIVRLGDNRTISSNFSLQDEMTELNEVNISKEKSPITIKGDTTSFSLKGFRQGNEKTLEDIIKKLPGMYVDDNGSISFKGNKIDKVLLENEDFYKEKYKNLTQNFNQINIDTIEAIENYLEEDILTGFFKSGKTVLNLKLSKSDGIHASGNLELGLGNDNRYDISSNAVLWRNKIKFMNMTALNNVSKGVINYIPEVQSYDKLTYSIQPVSGTNIFLPINNINGNLRANKLVLNPNFVIRPFQKLAVKGSGGYYNQKERSILNSTLNYFGQNNFLNQNSLSNTTAKDEVLDYELEFKYAINKISRVKNTISYTKAKNLLLQTEDIRQNIDNSISSSYLPTSFYNKLSNNIDYLQKKNASTLYNMGTHLYLLELNNTSQNILSRTTASIVDQLSFNKNYISDSYLRIYKKIDSSIIAYGLGISSNYEEMNSDLNFLNKVETNVVTSKLLNFYTNFGFVKMIKSYNLSLKSTINFTNRNLELKNELSNIRKILPSISVRNDFKLSPSSTTSITFNYENISVGTNQLYREFMIIGNRSYSKNSTINTSIYKKTDVTVFFAYNNFFEKYISINGFFTFGVRPVSGNIYGIDLDRSISTSFNNYRKPYFLSSFSFSKFLPFIASTLKMEVTQSQSSYLGVINSSELQTFKNSNSTFSTKVITGFKGIFNADASFSASISKLKSKNLSSPPVMFQTKLNLYLSFENFYASIKNNLISYDKNISSRLLYSDFKMEYKPKEKKFTFGGTISNIFDNKQFFQQIKTNLYERTLAYELNNRYFIINCNYTF